MDNIIDSLVVTLGLDPSKFRQGKKEADQGLKDIRDRAKEGKEQIVSFGEKLVGLFAVFTAGRGLKDFVEDMTAANTQLERASRNLDVNAAELSAWGAVVERNGGSADELQQTLKGLSVQQTELAVTGQSSMLPYFNALGISLTDAHLRARPLTQILRELAGSERLQRMPRPQAANLLGMMGFGQGTVNTILGGDVAALDKLIARQRELYPMTQRQAEQSERLSMAMYDFRREATGVGNQLLNLVTPALTKFFTVMTSVLEYLNRHRALLAGVIAPALLLVARAAWAFVAPWLVAAAPILATVAALGLLIDDWETWRKGGRSALGEFWQGWVDLWQRIGDSSPMVVNAIRRALGFVGDALTGALKGEQFGGPLGAAVGLAYGAARGGTGKEKGVIAFFESQGWSHAQASGIAANLVSESRLDPNARGDGGRAYGIGQWHEDRQIQLRDFAGRRNLDPSDLQTQLRFVQYELTMGEDVGARRAGRLLRGTNDPAASGSLFSQYYERPADRAGEAAKRGRLAGQLATMRTAALPSNYVMQRGGNRTSSAETNIGQLNVYSAAKDAPGIASDIHSELRDQGGLADQADFGPS